MSDELPTAARVSDPGIRALYGAALRPLEAENQPQKR
jgi:hypothetical protein